MKRNLYRIGAFVFWTVIVANITQVAFGFATALTWVSLTIQIVVILAFSVVTYRLKSTDDLYVRDWAVNNPEFAQFIFECRRYKEDELQKQLKEGIEIYTSSKK